MKPLHSLFVSATLVCGLAMPATALELGVSAGGSGASVSIGGGGAGASVSVGGSGGGVSVGGSSGGHMPSDPSNPNGGPTLAGADGGDPSRINQIPPAPAGTIVGTAVWTLDNVLIGVVTSHKPASSAGMVIIDVQTADEFGLSRDRVQLQIQRSAFQDGQLRLSHDRNRLLQLLS